MEKLPRTNPSGQTSDAVRKAKRGKDHVGLFLQRALAGFAIRTGLELLAHRERGCLS